MRLAKIKYLTIYVFRSIFTYTHTKRKTIKYFNASKRVNNLLIFHGTTLKGKCFQAGWISRERKRAREIERERRGFQSEYRDYANGRSKIRKTNQTKCLQRTDLISRVPR